MKNRISKITKEMEEAVLRSGYLLEQEVDNFLRKNGYLTTPIYTFQKPNGEIREIDILGESPVLISKKGDFEFVSLKLLVEVKNVSPVICFTRKPIVPIRCFVGDLQFSGMPKNIWNKRNEGIDLLDFLNVEKFHHYYKKEKVSSQLCVISEKHKAQKDEPHYIASHRFGGERNLYEELVSPLVDGIIYLKEEDEEEWEFDPKKEPINLNFYYPVVVVTDLFEYYIDAKNPHYKKVHQVNFLRMHKAQEISGELLRIDICDENGFKQLVGKINDEFEVIIKRIKNKRSLFRESALKDAKEKYLEQRKMKTKKKG